MSNISLVSVGALIGIVLTVLLVLVMDLLLMGFRRVSPPWASG